MIIFDTNVISELMHSEPDQQVKKWIEKQNRLNCATTTINIAEIKVGLAKLPHGKRRRGLEESFQKLGPEVFEDRIFPFDQTAAALYADIFVECEQNGYQPDPLDCMIAAIAKSKKATVATRNVKDFKACNVNIINPWNHGLASGDLRQDDLE